MTMPGKQTHRLSSSRRAGGRRGVVPAVTALLVPILGAAPAAAANRAIPNLAPAFAPSGSSVIPAPLLPSGTYSVSLNAGINSFDQQAAALRQREETLTAEKQSLAQRAAKDNAAADKYNAEDAACAARVKAHNGKLDAYNARVDAHNAAPHDFLVPDQQAESDAYGAEKAELDDEGAALEQELASITAEQRQLDTEEAQLSAEQTRLTEAMNSHNEKVRSWESDQQRLVTLRQQLLQQMAAALMDLLATPPGAAAASMAQGGDAPEPPDPAGEASAASGGDPASRADQVASVSYYAATNGVRVDFHPVVVQLSPGTIANMAASDAAQLILSATYDGLMPEANGHFRAIEIQNGTAGTGTDPGRSAVANVLAHGGQATARLGGSPVVIDGVTTVPAATRPGPSTCLNNRLPGASSNAQNGGWDYYAPQGHAGRAEGAIACAAKKNPDYNRAGESAGWSDATVMASPTGRELNDCHLVPSVLGGSGAKKNIAACWRETNVGANSMRTIEAQAQQAVQAKLVVLYIGLPIYATGTSTIPTGFALSFVAQSPTGGPSTARTAYVANDGNGSRSNLGN